jgi:hypothetical protein
VQKELISASAIADLFVYTFHFCSNSTDYWHQKPKSVESLVYCKFLRLTG